MAVVKLSSSGKQLQFIDDEGNMFVTSAAFVMGLMQNRSKHGFLLLSRYPNKISKDRFKQSPLWDPSGLAANNEQHENVNQSSDGLSIKSRKEQEEVKQFKDKKVW